MRNHPCLSQADVAKLLGLHRPAVTAIEAGLRKLTLSEAIILFERTDIGLFDLTRGTPIGF